MKTSIIWLFGAVLTLTLSTAAVAQFNDKVSDFAAPGPADEEKEYVFIVPEGATLKTPGGETYKGGEMISIPGKYLELLATDRAEEIVTLGNAVGQQTEWTEVERANYAVLMLTIPEGASVTRKDGTVIDGLAMVPIVVTVADLGLSEEAKKEYRRLQWGSQ
jgi:hypothetical protein